MGWLIVLGVLVVLGCLPIGVKAEYYENGPAVSALIGPLNLTVFPKEKKTKEKSKKNAPTKKKFASHQQVKQKRGGKLTDFLPIMNEVLDFLVDFRQRLRVRNLEFKLVLAADDPCDLSIRYGSICAAVGGVLPLLERAFVIKHRKINVECDYIAEESLVESCIEFTFSLANLLWIMLFHGSRILSKYYKIMKLTKDGATL